MSNPEGIAIDNRCASKTSGGGPSIARFPVIALLLLVTATAVAAPRAGEPAEKAQARVLLQQGNLLFERGDLKGALANFRAAYALYPSPKLLVNAAACERELGDWVAAANDLSAFLEEPGEDAVALVPRARAELATLEPRLGRVGLQPGWPAGATLDLDGRPVPPRAISYVRPGEHRLRGRAPGRDLQRTVTVAAGEQLLLPVPPAAPAVGAALGTALMNPEPPAPRRRWWIAGVVVGVVAVGVGVGLGVGLGTRSSQPVSGDLGVITTSSFK